jgi:hypothetical protein
VSPRPEITLQNAAPRFTIDQSLRDVNLLGGALNELSTWSTWTVVLKAAFGLPLTRAERRTFKLLAGDRKPPKQRVKELFVLAGRQSGKSRMSAAISAYIATFIDHRSKLAPGELGYILTLSPSLDQSQIIYRYTLAFLETSAILRQKVHDANATEIKCANNIVISTHSASFRTVRGRTLLAVVFDESAFFRDESSARYMGWVQQTIGRGREVFGVIVAKSIQRRFRN